jgi:hypothetical protein
VKENKSFYTQRQLQRAQQARNLARALGCPSDTDFKAILKMNTIKDCPVVESDIQLAENIFGKDVAVLKGKTTRQKSTIVIHDTVAIPQELKIAQQEVTISIDTFFVNKMAFFHTISGKIKYRTSQFIPDREIATYTTAFTVVLKIYQRAGFRVRHVNADREFIPVLNDMRDEFGFIPNIATAHEHVPEVERSIRVVKERCRATIHGNPFKSLPRILLKSVVQECTRKLNYFPAKGGCSLYYSPREILHELKLNYVSCKIPQLAYVMAHDEPKPTNPSPEPLMASTCIRFQMRKEGMRSFISPVTA